MAALTGGTLMTHLQITIENPTTILLSFLSLSFIPLGPTSYLFNIYFTVSLFPLIPLRVILSFYCLIHDSHSSSYSSLNCTVVTRASVKHGTVSRECPDINLIHWSNPYSQARRCQEIVFHWEGSQRKILVFLQIYWM